VSAVSRVASHGRGRVAAWLAVFALLVYVVSGGGRVVSSDEVTMLELSRALLHGHVWVPEGATLRGPDGRDYSKNAAAQAVLALPVVAVAELGARAAHMEPSRANLAVRFAASFVNAFVIAVLLALFYLGARALGAGKRASLFGALLLGFGTPVWVYAKSFLAEPLEALGLFAALLGASLAGATSRAERLAAAGAFIAVSVKLSMLPLALGVLVPLLGAPRRTWIWPALGIALALLGHGIYDLARFGTPFETGYGVQATPAAYTTPIVVGLYGLLLSSGKGLAWFAPAVWLAPSGAAAMLRERASVDGTLARIGFGTPRGRAAWGVIVATVAALGLYSRFQHWAGDGSFGPRYLVPLLPLLVLCVTWFVIGTGTPSRPRRLLATALFLLGVFVQIGGVSIYFGAQMREAGDYPYTLPLDHPRFMSDSHFNPRFSPIAGHWRMLERNAGEQLRGQAPRLTLGGGADARVGVSAEDQRALLHGLDFWWLYLRYAGVGGPAPAALALVLAALAAFAAWRLARAVTAEQGTP